MFKVLFYEEKNGKCPIQDFLDGLEVHQRAKMIGLIELLGCYGNLLREPYSKHLGDKIFELRCSFGNNITRALYFFYSGQTIVMTNGFTKKTQKTPKGEIELAKKYMLDFKKRSV